MKTKRGIYTDITESNYCVTLEGITFYFSSMFYLDKFIGEFENELDRFNQSLNKMYKNKYDVIADQLALIRLYQLIEKRGFYIMVEGVEIHSINDIQFNVNLALGI